MTRRRFPRRHFLQGLAGTALLVGCGRAPGPEPRTAPDDAAGPEPHTAPGNPAVPPPSEPAAARVCAPTADNIEGPFFKAGAPQRAILADASTEGVPLELTGVVTGPDCRPLAGAVMEIWHADHSGAYDNDGFGFRGRLITDAGGRYQVRTIVPGHYLNGRRYRPAHVHVKLAAAGLEPLTTQLYFPGDPWNDGDPYIVDSLIMRMSKRGDLMVGAFDFALARIAT